MYCRLPDYVIYSFHEEHNLIKTLFIFAVGIVMTLLGIHLIGFTAHTTHH